MSDHDLTEHLLSDAVQGDRHARRRLFVMVQAELHRIAHAQMRNERIDHTLQTTALVNEAFVRICNGAPGAPGDDLSEFLSYAARVMRQILIDHARKRLTQKRGQGQKPLGQDAIASAVDSAASCSELLAIHEALDRLHQVNSRAARVVELKMFGEQANQEIASALHVSPETIKKDWRFAKAFLIRELSPGGDNRE